MSCTLSRLLGKGPLLPTSTDWPVVSREAFWHIQEKAHGNIRQYIRQYVRHTSLCPCSHLLLSKENGWGIDWSLPFYVCGASRIELTDWWSLNGSIRATRLSEIKQKRPRDPNLHRRWYLRCGSTVSVLQKTTLFLIQMKAPYVFSR